MIAQSNHWTLHPQLAADSVTIGDLSLSRVLLTKDADYPWIILVPRRPDVVEILDLEKAEQAQLMREIVQAAAALKDLTACDKLNIAALGNVVSQLHVHIVARRKGDAAWPAPIWGRPAMRRYQPQELQQLTAGLAAALGLDDPQTTSRKIE